MSRLEPWRIWAFALGTLALIGVAVGYSVFAGHRSSPAHASAGSALVVSALPLSATAGPRVLYVDTKIGPATDRLAEAVPTDPGATPAIGAQDCSRSYTAGGTLLCLREVGTLPVTLEADVYRSAAPGAQPVRKVELSGTPSRARVSADGRLAAWTVFVAGDAYSGPAFSTRTGILDTRTGTLIDSLEAFTPYVGASRYRAVDINFWGVTFAADDRTFYATMGSHGQTWLMRGDLATRQLHSVTGNVECPSLSPDGTRIAFKKRVGTNLSAPWRLYVLDPATGQQHPLAETRSIDDQAAWLDADTVMYAVPHTDGTGYDIWKVPADGSGRAALLIRDGSSPAVVGG